MMKKILLFLIASAGVLHSQTCINIWSDGKVTSIPIQEIQKLTFTDIQSAVQENEDIATVIKSFKLLQNYPNPFNPTTIIEYEIPEKGSVDVNIFSINGQLVKTFHNNYSSAGAYHVVWNGKNDADQTVTSGLYIYRVCFENSIVSKSMIFIK